jgi:hypothetical protein
VISNNILYGCKHHAPFAWSINCEIHLFSQQTQ